MAETTPVAAPATLPSSKDIERASKFTREPFVSEGEDAATVLAPGTPHRRAFDAAMTEIEAGAKVPSVAWRRTYSLLLGLERLLSEDEPALADLPRAEWMQPVVRGDALPRRSNESCERS